MRIAETKLVQFIDSEPPKVVLVNEIDGIELILYAEEFHRALNNDFSSSVAEFVGDDVDYFMGALQYFRFYMH